MDNYPPGMTMRDFDRAYHDPDEDCDHGNWQSECAECKAEYEMDMGDQKYDAMKDEGE